MTLEDESLNANVDNEMSSKNCFRLVILGGPRVGKSCIINWLLGFEFNDSYIPTIEGFHKKMFKIRGEIFRLDILDTSGNDPFPAIKKLNIMTGDLFVLVFNIDDSESFNQIKQLQDLILDLKKAKQKDSKKKIPILILANKKDLSLQRRITNRSNDTNESQHVNSSVFSKSSLYFEISCKQSLGIENAFEKLFIQANLPIEMLPTRHRRISLNLDLTKPQFSTKVRPGRNQSEPYEPFGLLNSEKDSPLCKQAQFDKRKDMNNDTNPNEPTTPINRLTDRGSFKIAAKKSFRKMTFRPKLVEACGTVMLNARRPSIRSELKMLNTKTDTHFFYHRHQSVDTKLLLNSNYQRNDSVTQFVIQKARKFFSCFKKPRNK